MPVKKTTQKPAEKKVSAATKVKEAASNVKVDVKNVVEESKKVTFKVVAPDANSVFVAGDFNNWDASQKGLKKNAKGEWSSVITLKPGKYQYKFVIDGNWIADQGSENVSDEKGNINNLKVVK